MGKATITVEVVAGTAGQQVLVTLQLPAGTTILEAVAQSGLAERLPEIEIDPGRMGIFGRIRPPDTQLSDGDRVEVYRPLTADPKEIRRQLAELERSGK